MQLFMKKTALKSEMDKNPVRGLQVDEGFQGMSWLKLWEWKKVKSLNG